MFTQPRVIELPLAAPTDGREYVTRTAVWLRGSVHAGEALVLVARGAAAAHLPALALALRALGAPAVEYRLVDPTILPPPAAEWPDAPVSVLQTAAATDEVRALATKARLRGWTVEPQ